MNEAAVTIENVSKSFKLPHERYTGLKQAILNFRPGRNYETQQVLKNIDFRINKGDFFGIVGRNGSGKSTLLKLLAQIYTPDSGKITVKGSLTPFIELGVGFNPELTGRENVYLNGALLGFDRKQMASMYNDIVSFAELERFMDQKLKNYSSGMQVRLAFSIAIRAKSDVLVLDEVLAVGDESFQRKCLDVFEGYKGSRQTVVLVTHDMDMVRKFCNRAILIHDGELRKQGDPSAVADEYTALNDWSIDTYTAKKNRAAISSLQTGIYSANGESSTRFHYGDDMLVRVVWGSRQINHIGVAIFSQAGEYVFGTNTQLDDYTLSSRGVECRFKLSLGPGRYYLKIGAFDDTKKKAVEFIANGPLFTVDSQKAPAGEGLTRLAHSWQELR